MTNITLIGAGERRDHVYQAVMLDPNAGATLTIAQIRSIVDELIDPHGELMPAGIRAGARRRPAWQGAGGASAFDGVS